MAHHPPEQNRAFTLLELLLVSTVIAALLLLAIAGIGRLRQKADDIKCVNNLRRLGEGVFAYSSDFQGAVIPRYLGLLRGKDDPPAPPSDLRTWPQRLLKLGYIQNRDTFYCPSFFPRNDREAEKKAENGAAQTYGLRLWVTPGQSWNAKEKEEHKPLSAIRKPSEFFLIADSVWVGEGWKSQGYGLSPGSMGQKVHLRHHGKANALFADGHIEAKGADYFAWLSSPEGQQAYTGGVAKELQTTSEMVRSELK